MWLRVLVLVYLGLVGFASLASERGNNSHAPTAPAFQIAENVQSADAPAVSPPISAPPPSRTQQDSYLKNPPVPNAAASPLAPPTSPLDRAERSVASEHESQCGTKQYCKDMRTCAEAQHYMTNCGLSELDRDGDGVPCETLCGKTLSTMASRMKAQPFVSTMAPTTGSTLGLLQSGSGTEEFKCGEKRTCKQMLSCEEATFHLQSCGVKSLDGNGDGIACNGLCRQ